MGIGISSLIRKMRAQYDGFDPPLSEVASRAYGGFFDRLPAGVAMLYRNHDGAPALPRRDDTFLPARLMPLEEAVHLNTHLPDVYRTDPRLGDVVWLWADDSSNYAGVYLSEPLRGFVSKLAHDEPVLTPAWRSVTNFLSALIESARNAEADGHAAMDIPTLPPDLPVVQDGEHVEADRMLARELHSLYAAEQDADHRRRYAQCAMALTPVCDSDSVLPFLLDPDMWTPESAIRLFELRNYRGSTDELERLARGGSPNGDSAAMRLLVRMRTPEADAALSRLCGTLRGDKRKRLDVWLRGRDRLQSPCWP